MKHFAFFIFFCVFVLAATAQNKLPVQPGERFAVIPLSILQYDLNIKVSNDKVKAYACLRFYDLKDRALLEYKTAPYHP